TVTQTTGRDSYATAVAKNVIVAALYVTINYINGTLVHTFFKHEIFTENPRYILFIHMVLNDMIQLTMAVLLYIISYIFFTMNVSLCCLIVMIAMFTTLNTPLNLAGMAVERYIAVCKPLHHTQICTVRRTYILIGLIWVFSAISILPDLFILLATEPLYYFLSTIICSRDLVFRHRYLIEKKNISHLVYLSFVWLTLFYTYLRVILAAHAMSTDKVSVQRARNTILLHGAQLLMCMLSYVYSSIETLLNIIFPGQIREIRYVNYLISFIMPRFLSPIIYGVRDQKFRKYLKRNFRIRQCKVKTRVHNQEEET
ncbi:olfactory receptor 11G2-like, partial [Astyanax mexicanus]